MGNKTTFVFDLDGTLVDGVYQRVLAWQTTLEAADRAVGVADPPAHRDEAVVCRRGRVAG